MFDTGTGGASRCTDRATSVNVNSGMMNIFSQLVRLRKIVRFQEKMIWCKTDQGDYTELRKLEHIAGKRKYYILYQSMSSRSITTLCRITCDECRVAIWN